MIRFDKLKIVSPISAITDIHQDAFVATSKNNVPLSYKYEQTTPYSLSIRVDYCHSELVIEFTGKVLMEKYPLLINKDTIRPCLENINNLNLCHLNVEDVLAHGQVAKSDVAKDIDGNIADICSAIRPNLSNYKKWTVRQFYCDGIVLENVVKTPRYKKRMIVYDKDKELKAAHNKSIYGYNEVRSYFKNKVRFELNIGTMKQIREILNIPDNRLTTVLNATANPLLSVIDEAIITQPTNRRTMTLRDREREALLQQCGHDLVKLEAIVRACCSKTTSISRQMQPYRELMEYSRNCNEKRIDIRELLC